MYKPDIENFRELLNGMANLYSKPKPDDVTFQTYWHALKDLPFEVVKARADAHSKFAKFFPKPSELRPKDDRPKSDDASFNAAVRECQYNLEERLRKDPRGTKWLLLQSLLARISVTETSGSIVLHERMQFCREVFARLLTECGGPAYFETDWNAWRMCIELDPKLAGQFLPQRQEKRIAA